MEEYTGKNIDNNALSEAFKVTNETRRLLKQVSGLRKTFPPRISGCEALPIIMASMLIPKAEYNKLLKQFLSTEVNNLPQKDSTKIRLYVSGSSLDNLQLYELIESLPAVIVGEDTALGDRYAEMGINEEMDPIEALCDRYTYKPPDPWMLGMNDILKYRVNSTLAAGAQGEIYFHIEHDSAAGWDYPEQKKELGERGILVLPIEPQSYKLSNLEQIKNKVAAFINEVQNKVRK